MNRPFESSVFSRLLPPALLACAGVVFIVGARAQPPKSQAQLQGNAGRGKALYTQYSCHTCHGFSGETGPGARLNPAWMGQTLFIAYLRNPPKPTRMPPYQQREVTDQKLADIYAFIESLPKSPEAATLPLLEALLKEP